MENTDMQADFQRWLRTGWDNKDASGNKYYWQRQMTFTKKMRIKDVYDAMIRSSIKWPTEFKQKGKKIIFTRQGGCEPTIFLKGKKLFVRRNTKNTKVSGFDINAIKQAAVAVKDAVQGQDVSDTVLITNPEQYFLVLCDSTWQLFYDRVSDKQLKRLRKWFS